MKQGKTFLLCSLAGLSIGLLLSLICFFIESLSIPSDNIGIVILQYLLSVPSLISIRLDITALRYPFVVLYWGLLGSLWGLFVIKDGRHRKFSLILFIIVFLLLHMYAWHQIERELQWLENLQATF